MTIDQEKLTNLINAFAGDLGATMAAGGVVVGHRLGLYRALAQGPATAEQLAERTGCNPRYLTEWLRSQAAGGYVGYDPGTDRFTLSEEQAFALANPDGPVYLPGAFVLALGALRAEPQITEAFRTGDGYGWDQHDADVFDGCELFFRPGYLANLVPSWIPALDDVQDKLAAGARVADVGTGLGASAVLLAQAFPAATISGSDYTTPPSSWPASGQPRPAWPTASASRWPPPRRSPAPDTTWSPPSTASMTWATPSAPPGTFARPWHPTAPG